MPNPNPRQTTEFKALQFKQSDPEIGEISKESTRVRLTKTQLDWLNNNRVNKAVFIRRAVEEAIAKVENKENSTFTA